MHIDSHIHWYPEEDFKCVETWAKTWGESYWKDLVLGSPDQKSIQGWASIDKMLADMDDANVDKVVMLGWYWEHQATCRWHNECYIKWAKEYPDKLIPFASVQPLEGEKALDDLKWAVDNGARGIGEIFAEVQGFSMIHDPSWLNIIEFAIENDLPVNIHVTEPVGHDYLGRIESPLSEFQWLATEYPELKMILAHWGGLLPFYEMNPKLKKTFKNTYYDTSASPLLYDISVFRRVIDTIGPEKILFGSDYPLRLYPKSQKEPDFKRFMQQIKTEANLTPDELECILHKNIEQLLGI